MIRVTVELLNKKSKFDTVSVVEIDNNQTGTETHGNYTAIFYDVTGEKKSEVFIQNHNRKLNMWYLILKVVMTQLNKLERELGSLISF